MTTSAHAPLPASTILQALLSALRNTATFIVLRNYEGLPEHWSNDIDILVAHADLERSHAALIDALRRVANPEKIEILQRINFRAVRLSCADRILQIDLYSAMCKGWITYADTPAIIEGRRPWNELFEVPWQVHELLLIAAKELLAYGEIRPRYHNRLTGHNLQDARVEAARLFGTAMTDDGQVLVSSALVNPTIQGRPGLRLGALLHPGAALEWARTRSHGWTVLEGSLR